MTWGRSASARSAGEGGGGSGNSSIINTLPTTSQQLRGMEKSPALSTSSLPPTRSRAHSFSHNWIRRAVKSSSRSPSVAHNVPLPLSSDASIPYSTTSSNTAATTTTTAARRAHSGGATGRSRDDTDEFACCGLSDASMRTSGESSDASSSSAALVAAYKASSQLALQHPFLQSAMAAGGYSTRMPQTAITVLDPACGLYDEDEDTLDMIDLLDKTLVPMVMSPLLPSPVSPPTPLAALPVDKTGAPFKRPPRHARSMPAIGASFRNGRRAKASPGAAAATGEPVADIATVTAMADEALPSRSLALRLELGPERKTEPMPNNSPLRTRRRKPPLTIDAAGVAAPVSAFSATSPVLSPSTPTSGTLRMRRSKISLKASMVSSPPPCPPPATPLPDLPGTPLYGFFDAQSTVRRPAVRMPAVSADLKPVVADAPKAFASVSAATPSSIAPQLTTTTTATTAVPETSATAVKQAPCLRAVDTGHTLSTASNRSSFSKVSNSQYESLQASPTSAKIDVMSPMQSQQPQPQRNSQRLSFLVRSTRSSVAVRDSRQSFASIALLADASITASNGNHSASTVASESDGSSGSGDRREGAEGQLSQGGEGDGSEDARSSTSTQRTGSVVEHVHSMIDEAEEGRSDGVKGRDTPAQKDDFFVFGFAF